MELAFLISAVRRYLWVIVAGVVLGLLPGLLSSGLSGETYESRAVLLINPPTQARSLVTFQGDPDRYVSGELSVLESLSDRVEEVVGGSAKSLGTTVTFIQQPFTDVVVIAAEAPTPELAKETADAYVEVYFDVLNRQLDGTHDPALAQVDAELEELQTELSDIDRRLTEALAPYLNREALPTPEQVAPALASEKAVLVTRYNELQSTRSELSSGLRTTSRVIREADLPTEPVASSNKRLIVLGGVLGGFLGLILAILLARFSSTVLDSEQAEEILGHGVVGDMPLRLEVVDDRRALLDPPSAEAGAFLDTLAVRTEAAVQGTDAMTIVVCGTRRGAGTTTLAVSLARQLVGNGFEVLLVDADRQHSELASLFIGDVDEAAELGVVGTSVEGLRATTLAGLRTLAAIGSGGSGRRPDAATLVATAHHYADVVVIDGGALMESATTVRLSRAADVVVLAMPHRQQIRPLDTISAELQFVDHVLPVWTHSAKRRSTRIAADGGVTEEPGQKGPELPDSDPSTESDKDSTAAQRT